MWKLRLTDNYVQFSMHDKQFPTREKASRAAWELFQAGKAKMVQIVSPAGFPVGSIPI